MLFSLGFRPNIPDALAYIILPESQGCDSLQHHQSFGRLAFGIPQLGRTQPWLQRVCLHGLLHLHFNCLQDAQEPTILGMETLLLAALQGYPTNEEPFLRVS